MHPEDCPVKSALDVIGGKWKPSILRELKDQPRRFGELRRALPGVRHKVLTEQLRQLEQEGILSHTVLPGKIVQSEYRLTPYGETLRPALNALAEWGITHRERAAAHGQEEHALVLS